MGQASQELVAAVVEDHGLGQDPAEARHPFAEPGRNAAAVEREVGAARAFAHGSDYRVPHESSPGSGLGRMPLTAMKGACSILLQVRFSLIEEVTVKTSTPIRIDAELYAADADPLWCPTLLKSNDLEVPTLGKQYGIRRP